MIIRIFQYLIILAFIIRTFRNLLYQSFLWQLKEYRLDRMLAHLRTEQGKRLIINPVSIVKWILFFSGVGIITYSFLTKIPLQTFGLVIVLLFFSFWLIWIVEAGRNIRELLDRGWKLPKFSLKMAGVLVVNLIFCFGLIAVEDKQTFLLYAPVLDILLAPVLALTVFIFAVPTSCIKKVVILLAQRKIAQFKNLIVIGVTGSFGKTTTKEYLATILSEKFNSLRTVGYHNTELAIAKIILGKLSHKHECFIVEMGAYKKGEIKAICNMVKPKIGIITGINQQHLELFGSLTNLIKAKFELVEGLQNGGIAVFNLGNGYIREMISWTKDLRRDIEIRGYSRDNHKNSLLAVSEIDVSPNKMSFNLAYKRKKIACVTKLAGLQNLDSILAASTVAVKLGLKLTDIKKAVSKLQSPPHTMHVIKKFCATLIDDTFNANPDGVLAGLEYLNLFNGKKYLVLTPLIELGKTAAVIHQSIGRKAASICDGIYLTNSNHKEDILEVVKRNSPKDKIIPVNISDIEKDLKVQIKRKCTVLFLGREAGKILGRIR